MRIGLSGYCACAAKLNSESASQRIAFMVSTPPRESGRRPTRLLATGKTLTRSAASRCERSSRRRFDASPVVKAFLEVAHCVAKHVNFAVEEHRSEETR